MVRRYSPFLRAHVHSCSSATPGRKEKHKGSIRETSGGCGPCAAETASCCTSSSSPGQPSSIPPAAGRAAAVSTGRAHPPLRAAKQEPGTGLWAGGAAPPAVCGLSSTCQGLSEHGVLYNGDRGLRSPIARAGSTFHLAAPGLPAYGPRTTLAHRK
ncbi:hypothetical protein NDU88_004156 [Pleurodeles waltl]|uniref:Uncharacterized protein n=1 Tax=Pleurodeles waltl TaxID=8319 RepID=A0AAV7W478_PLEWA|nr:hypothetical protein NDU88_004156 [Pleurodeles waltl]